MSLRPIIPRLTQTTTLFVHHTVHSFSTTRCYLKNHPPRTPLLDADIIENFLKGSGPGGQKINKTASAVQLKHIPTGIVVKYQDTRSREINRKMARRILQDRIEELELGDEARTRVKAREKSKKKASSSKKSKRKYKALAAAKEDGHTDDASEGDNGLPDKAEPTGEHNLKHSLPDKNEAGRKEDRA